MAFLLVGCGTVTTQRIMTGPARTPTQSEIQVAAENEPLPPTFTEIALLTANGYGMLSTEADVLDALRTQAAQLGADAIVRLHFDRGASSVFGTGVAVVLHGGPVRGSEPTAVPTGSVPAPTPPSGAIPAVPPGYEDASAQPPVNDAIPPPPESGAMP